MDRQDAAEQVRAHLVVLRGGAPFLSPLDGRLLTEWLDAGVPVTAILYCLEQEAERRRKKRKRTPLKLSSIRAAVRKEAVRPVVQPSADGLGPYLELLRASPVSDEREAAERLQHVQGADLVAAVLDAVRELHEQRWAQADRQALQAEAEAELEPLRGSMAERDWERAVDEVARDRLRQRTPLLSATAIWDTVRA